MVEWECPTNPREASGLDPEAVHDRTLRIGERSRAADRPTVEIADELARDRIESVGNVRSKVHETRRPAW